MGIGHPYHLSQREIFLDTPLLTNMNLPNSIECVLCQLKFVRSRAPDWGVILRRFELLQHPYQTKKYLMIIWWSGKLRHTWWDHEIVVSGSQRQLQWMLQRSRYHEHLIFSLKHSQLVICGDEGWLAQTDMMAVMLVELIRDWKRIFMELKESTNH